VSGVSIAVASWLWRMVEVPRTEEGPRWCRTTQWPLPDWYARCPYCDVAIEDKLHPRFPGLPDLSYAPVETDDQGG
jgi:hypothetical protein